MKNNKKKKTTKNNEEQQEQRRISRTTKNNEEQRRTKNQWKTTRTTKNNKNNEEQWRTTKTKKNNSNKNKRSSTPTYMSPTHTQLTQVTLKAQLNKNVTVSAWWRCLSPAWPSVTRQRQEFLLQRKQTPNSFICVNLDYNKLYMLFLSQPFHDFSWFIISECCVVHIYMW